MANKFISFLETAGKDVEFGIEKAAPFLQAFSVTIAPVLAPGFAPLISTVIGTIIQTEQKFAAIGKQSGTGEQKLSNALTVLQPVVAQAFIGAKLPADATTITNFVNAIVNFLNALPAAPVAA